MTPQMMQNPLGQLPFQTGAVTRMINAENPTGEKGGGAKWDPNPDDYVRSILVWGGKVYVGGYFANVGGSSRSYIAALDPVTGMSTSWNPGANGPVYLPLAIQSPTGR